MALLPVAFIKGKCIPLTELTTEELEYLIAKQVKFRNICLSLSMVLAMIIVLTFSICNL